MSLPRPEYPRPQFARSAWLCLNGSWQFEIDGGDSGIQRDLLNAPYSRTITVPFCPESALSNVKHEDFMLAVWYRKSITVPSDWQYHTLWLHFGAVDYDTTVWVNGKEAGRHRGGFTPFSIPVDNVTPGQEFTVVVRARDDWRQPKAKGKQSGRYAPNGCVYTRTTGIWQTVWLEPLPAAAFMRPRITPDVAGRRFHLELPMIGATHDCTVKAELRAGSTLISEASVEAGVDFAARLILAVPDEHVNLWEPGNPYLYDITLKLVDSDGAIIDECTSYAGLRSVSIDGKAIRINGKSVFQRLVLDQGYYPDGVMTAPSDAALEADIRTSMEAGFNGARLHQKVFEERFLYHADRLGYLVWGEFGDWGCGGFGPNRDHQKPAASYITQWLEALERDYSHPSIIGWCPLNETWQRIEDEIVDLDDVTVGMYLATKAMDTSRPVLDSSGYSHRVPFADVYDSHDYITNPDWPKGLEEFVKRHQDLVNGNPFLNAEGGHAISVPYRNQPYWVSEFGGFRWVPEAQRDSSTGTWGYGSDPTTLEDFYGRFKAVCDILLDNPDMFGYCYTQLTDVYPELNGIYTFDRRKKFDLVRLHAIQTRRAAIEERV